MKEKRSENTNENLIKENEELRSRLTEAEEALQAIRNGEIDAIVVSGLEGDKIFSLSSVETPYRIILEEMAEGAVIIMVDGTILYYNQRFSEIFKDSNALYVGSNISGVIAVDDKIRFHNLLNTGSRGRATGIFSYKSSPDKSEVYLNLALRSLPVEIDGDLCIIVSDITKMKKYQDHLQELVEESTHELEKQLSEIENLYKNVPVGLCVMDLDLRFLRINERLAEINGIPAKDHLGRTVAEILPGLLEMASGFIQRICTTGEPQLGIEISGTTPAQPGVLRYWTENWSPVKNKSGEIIAVNVAVTEITEQKLAQEKLNKKQEQLRKAKLDLQRSQKKLTFALENGKIGLWEWDVTKDISIWDRRMEEIFGLAPGTFDGKHSTFEDLIHEDDLPQVRISIEKAISEGTALELVFRTKERNGQTDYIMVKALIIKDKLNRRVTLTGVCFDVTKIQEGAERHIVKLNEELLRSNTDLRQFAYVASHDLQEPLRMVTSFTQLLQMQYKEKLDDNANEYINFAIDGSKRMHELLNGLLTFSRIQTRGTGFSDISMETVVRNVTENLRLLIDETGAEIIVEKLPVVKADANQMIQLMQNLIDNSIKFSKGKPSIHISCRNEKGKHIFSVRDNGIGIEQQYFERIFMIFQRLHLRDEYKGTGIGLAVSKKIVERHRGMIWVESEYGKGSTFSFNLPYDSQTLK